MILTLGNYSGDSVLLSHGTTTMRVFGAVILSFLIAMGAHSVQPRLLVALGIDGQPIRKDGPVSHEVKRGVPSMGGISIIFASVIASGLLCKPNAHVAVAILAYFLFGVIGFLDDWIKVRTQRSDGLSEKRKLTMQTMTATLISLLIFAVTWAYHQPISVFGIIVPFSIALVSLPLFLFVIVGTANAVNLTDGLDGLVTGPSIGVAVSLAVYAVYQSSSVASLERSLVHLPYAGELAVVLGSLCGALLAFVWFNGHPAEIFMGDTGSLAVGGLLAVIAIMIGQEFVLGVSGCIFVGEALSVILQRAWYKYTGGKRIFRMAPIHHHFELGGCFETKIVMRFWIISVVAAILSIMPLLR